MNYLIVEQLTAITLLDMIGTLFWLFESVVSTRMFLNLAFLH